VLWSCVVMCIWWGCEVEIVLGGGFQSEVGM
jgi:hypothetical protein